MAGRGQHLLYLGVGIAGKVQPGPRQIVLAAPEAIVRRDRPQIRPAGQRQIVGLIKERAGNLGKIGLLHNDVNPHGPQLLLDGRGQGQTHRIVVVDQQGEAQQLALLLANGGPVERPARAVQQCAGRGRIIGHGRQILGIGPGHRGQHKAGQPLAIASVDLPDQPVNVQTPGQGLAHGYVAQHRVGRLGHRVALCIHPRDRLAWVGQVDRHKAIAVIGKPIGRQPRSRRVGDHGVGGQQGQVRLARGQQGQTLDRIPFHPIGPAIHPHRPGPIVRVAHQAHRSIRLCPGKEQGAGAHIRDQVEGVGAHVAEIRGVAVAGQPGQGEGVEPIAIRLGQGDRDGVSVRGGDVHNVLRHRAIGALHAAMGRGPVGEGKIRPGDGHAVAPHGPIGQGEGIGTAIGRDRPARGQGRGRNGPGLGILAQEGGVELGGHGQAGAVGGEERVETVGGPGHQLHHSSAGLGLGARGGGRRQWGGLRARIDSHRGQGGVAPRHITRRWF